MINPNAKNYKPFARVKKDERLNIEAKVTANVTEGETYSLRGCVFHDGIKVSDVPEIRRTAPNKAAAELIASEMLTKLIKIYKEINRKTVARRNSSKNTTKVATYNTNKLVLSAFNTVKNQESINNWGRNTTHAMITWFERNFLNFLNDIIESRITFERSLVVDHITKIESANTELLYNLTKNLKKYLRVSQIIYNCMKSECPELPPLTWYTIDDIFDTVEDKYGYEQMKYLNTSVHAEFRKRVEADLVINPRRARAAAILDSGGLRTGEAVAVHTDEIIDYDDFVCVKVWYQYDAGKRTETLKSPNAYRYVVLDGWGESIVRQCNRIIGAEDNYDRALKEEELSKWGKKALMEAGLTASEIESWRQAMLLEIEIPNRRLEKDVVAYILRRNRCTIWDTICGYTSEELDVQIGHANYNTQYDWTSTDILKNLAIKAKRFRLNEGVEDKNICLAPGTSYIVNPERLVQFVATEPTTVSISLESVERGDAITIITDGIFQHCSSHSFKKPITDTRSIIVTVDDVSQWERKKSE